ncbi:MAG: calcium-binding protein, partial [Pseudomonadota bacterium]
MDEVSAIATRMDGTDLGLDFELVLLDTQTAPVVTNAGTAVEMSWEGIELVDLETGSGNDTLDARGVYFGGTNQGMFPRWDANGGDDHFIGDTGVYGTSSTPVVLNLGAGFDRLTLDWSLATNAVNMNPTNGIITGGTSTPAYAQAIDVEQYHITSGNQNDVLYGGDFADTFIAGDGRDRIFMGTGGGSVDGGAGGDDFVDADILTSDGTDLGLDFELTLLDTQSGTVVTNAGTAVETRWANVEMVDLLTGSGNDMLDQRGVFFGLTNLGSRPRWDAGDGDDHFIGDSFVSGSNSSPIVFAMGAGTDTFSWDLSNVTGAVTMNSGSSIINGRYRSGTFESSSVVSASDVEIWDIATGAGDDVLYGGDQHDTFSTGDGRDRLFMGLGGFSVDAGGGGDDYVVADILASDGTDLGLDFELSLLETQSGPVTINAGTGVETTWQNVEMVDLLTGSGNDMLDTRGVFFGLTNFGARPRWDAGDGDDHFLGDALVFGSSSVPIVVNLGAGTGDRFTMDWSNVTANLNITAGDGTFASRYRSGTFETNTYINTVGVEHWELSGGSGADQFTGGAFADRFEGNDGADTLRGLGGDDGLFGGAGGDRLEGGTGNDTLEGGAGADFMYGGEGIDTVSYESSALGVFIDLGNATVDLGDAVGDRITGFENATGSAFDDLIYGDTGGNTLRGLDGTDIVLAGDGNDDVDGGDGRDAIAGQAGNDTIRGGEGDDLLDGGTGNDTLDGGLGDDVFLIDHADDVLIEAAGEGYDRAFAVTSVVLGDHVEAGQLIAPGDLSLTASSTGSWLQGNSDNNTLTGQGANDRLDGNEGQDTINGGLGNDVLEGGADADVFVLSDGFDLILDFENGIDLIDLTDMGILFSDLRVIDAGANVQLGHGTGLLTLLNVDLADVTAADFLEPALSSAPVITGTEGDDNLTQTSGPLEVQGLGGNDLLRVFNGSATLAGG